jgi:hypothetical protein
VRILRRIFVVTVLITALRGNATQAQQLSTNQVIDRIVQRENEEMKTLHQYDPIVETYVQDLRPDNELGMMSITDHYFLGRAILSEGTVQRPSGGKKNAKPKSVKLGGLGGVFDKKSAADGFLNLIYVDSNAFDHAHYRFDYVRREFLDEVRCFVFDVTPLGEKDGDRFLGRIWVEDRDYTIVRFNGANSSSEHSKGNRLHFDSWRVNVGPGMWVPAYVYSAESNAGDVLLNHLLFQAQTLLWGYNPKTHPDDDHVTASQAAPGREAEEDGLDRLQAAGLLAPAGPVDKVLYTIVNNLEVTNNLDIEPDVACRVMLTSTLESFTVGHTIFISRGLLDILPDEASLAMVLAHELGHILSGHTLADRWAVRDWSVLLVEDHFDHFDFPIDAPVEQAANAKTIQLLNGSPYKDKLGNSVQFLQMLGTQAQSLPSLISPHLISEVSLANLLLTVAHSTPASKEQSISALPMGSRISLNPWTSKVDLQKSKLPALSSQKRQPLLINPSIPHLIIQSTEGPEQRGKSISTDASPQKN